MIISLLLIPLIGVLLILPLEGLGTLATSQPVAADADSKHIATQSPNFVSAIGLLLKTKNIDANQLMKKIALLTSLLNLFVSIYMWFQFDNSSTNYQFVYEFINLNFCHFHVGVDGISLYFVVRPLKDFGKFLIKGDKSSKSGDSLKIFIPSHNLKIMSGQTSYLGMVTIKNINESEIGYRGSKSTRVKPNFVVKEQRVYGD